MAAKRRVRSRQTSGLKKKAVMKVRAKKRRPAGGRPSASREAARKRQPRKTSSRGRSTARSKAAQPDTVKFRSEQGESHIALGDELKAAARRWRERLVKRARWQSRLERATQALESDLAALPGLEEEEKREGRVLPWLTQAELVEIEIPYSSEGEGWEARIAPWEFMLGRLRREREGGDDFAVVRHLVCNGGAKKEKLSVSRVLYVECAPAELASWLSFAVERRLVKEAFPDATHMHLESPTQDELRQVVIEFEPELIHVGGVDTRQARRILKTTRKLDDKAFLDDGIVLSNGERGIEPVRATRVAEILTAASTKPHLVLFNLYHSASRVSALCVAEGARYAIGFQDTVDDALAEMLCKEFYGRWIQAEGYILPAFVETIDVLRRAPSLLSGTGVVLWSSHSLMKDQAAKMRSLRARWKTEREKRIGLPKVYDHVLQLEIEPNDRVNYALMHNDAGGLFSRFRFVKSQAGTLADVQVEVELHVGADSFPYRTTLDLVDPYTSIEDQIKIPLTSDLVRTVQEPLKTSVYTEIRHESRVIHRDTQRVTLLPVDEWKDTDANRLWLPSFVLPRDPAVERIIESAQAHLMTLADDKNSGFDGYQCIAEDDPSSLEDLDLQVQAIWAAILHQYHVRYINPPPAYSEFSQRLRTPTQVLRGGYGTCIDLAILLASCLEYVDIRPVIFLLEGHAFAGYWRSERFYDEFIGVREEEELSPAEGEVAEETNAPVGWASEAAWIVGKQEYADVLRHVRQERLYPIETVGLTSHGSFWKAVDEGVENLRDPEEFQGLVDIAQARAQFLTPLPIIEERERDDA